MTEQEMKDLKVATPNSLDELVTFIKSLENEADDYGKAAYCASLAAYATFQYIAHREGLTGFQASCADLNFIARTRHIDGPFMIVDFRNHLYPQYNLLEKLRNSLDENKDWFKEQATKLLQNSPEAHPNVIAHWKKLGE